MNIETNPFKEFTAALLEMHWLDLIGLVLCLVFIILGTVRGLWWQVIRLVGLAAAVALARLLAVNRIMRDTAAGHVRAQGLGCVLQVVVDVGDRGQLAGRSIPCGGKNIWCRYIGNDNNLRGVCHDAGLRSPWIVTRAALPCRGYMPLLVVFGPVDGTHPKVCRERL